MTDLIHVKPSQIDVSNNLIGSQLGKCEQETIARNIILLCRSTDDAWKPFSWFQYAKFCTHNVTDAEKNILKEFCNQRLLTYNGDKLDYTVTDNFIAILWDFVIIDEATEGVSK